MRSLTSSRVASDDRRSDISGGSGASTLIRDSIFSTRSGNSQFRKFTASVGRPGLAREVREAVRSVISAQNTSRRVFAAEPLDYEKFITEKATELENDPQRELLMFPRDDVEELVETVDGQTVLPMISEKDITESTWLLTRDAVRNFVKPKRTIIFNYAKFSGDYNTLNEESMEADGVLSSLMFESDMISEEKTATETPCSGILKEGYVMVLKTESGLLDNFKSTKRRYSTVKRLSSGEIAIEMRRSRECLPKRPPMVLRSVQLRSARKGRTVLEVKFASTEKDRTELRALTLGFENDEDLSSWFHLLQREIASVAKGGDDDMSLKCLRQDVLETVPNEADSSSTASFDLGRGPFVWRGPRAVARALQPPVVERKNLFSLYRNLSPLPEPACEPSSMLSADSRNVLSDCPSHSSVQRFLVSFTKLELKLNIAPGLSQQIEPFYVSIFAYDVSCGKRVSEEFHLECSSDIGDNVVEAPKDDLTKIFGVSRMQLTCRTANQVILKTFCSSEDLWVVFRVDRMLSLDCSGDLYMKSSCDIRAVSKLQKLVQLSQHRLSEYRQRFAWTARPLRKTNIGKPASSNSNDYTLMQLFRCENGRLTDTDIQRYLNDFTKMEKTGKSIVPNSSVSMKVELLHSEETFRARVNSSMYALTPLELPGDTAVPPVFELQTFEDVIAEPYSDFVNLLYIYPLSLKYDSQRVFTKARNILCTVRFVRGDSYSTTVFFNRLHPSGPLISSGKCAVQYHQQFPQFSDEIKMKLPVCLRTSDHLLFSFSHISVGGQSHTKCGESVENAVGHAWLPLMWTKDRLVMESDEQEFALPVAADLPKSYFRVRPLQEGNFKENSDIKWVDQRPLFRCRLRLVSSVFTSEPRLQDFFQACYRLDCDAHVTDMAVSKVLSSTPPPSNYTVRSCSPLVSAYSFDDDHSIVKSVVACSDALTMVDTKKIIPFLHVVLSRLFELITSAPTEKLAISAMRTLLSICDTCQEVGHKRLLRAFVRDHFLTMHSREEPTHTALCRFIHPMIHSLQSDANKLAMLVRQSWFFLDVIAKSIAQTIFHRSLLKCPRKDRLPLDVLDQIGGFVATLISLLISKHRELPKESRTGITCVAFFLRCCLSFVDRGVVFKWINSTLQRLDECESKVMREYKLDILSIISQHEHWLPLCLPVLIDTRNQIQRLSNRAMSSDYSEGTGSSMILVIAVGSRFLPRIFNHVFQSSTNSNDKQGYLGCCEEWSLSPTYASHHFPSGLVFQELYVCVREPRDFRHRAIVLLRNLLAKHSYDERYSDMNIQRRLAMLYLPVVRFAMDYIAEMEDSLGTGTSTSSVSPPQLSDSQKTAFALSNFVLCEKFSQEEVQDILICVLYVIHRIPKFILGALCLDSGQNWLLQLFRLLEIALEAFRCRGKESRVPAESIGSFPAHCSAANCGMEQMCTEEGGPYSVSNVSLSMPFRTLQLLNMSQEVALIALEVSQSLAHTFMRRQTGFPILESQTFSKLFSIYLSLMDGQWSESVRLHAIAATSLFINMFHERLFESGPLDDLSHLVERVLVSMASQISTVQNSAAALLYHILRYGFEALEAYLAGRAMSQSVLKCKAHSMEKTCVDRLGRAGCQTTVALARLLGKKSTLSSTRLEKGLTILYNISSRYNVMKTTTFDQAVMELVHQLRGVMSATVSLKDAENDPIRLADLHIQLAESYRGSAALRSAWFEALAELHSAGNWHAEAAVCYAHALAIVANELAGKGGSEVDWSAFEWISSSVIADEGTLQPDGNIQPAGFSLENLATKIEQTAQALTLAERYEAIGPLYRLIIPLFEKTNNFKSLVGIYAELQQAYCRAAEVKTSGKRHLGTYFRVKFIGENHLKQDHDTDWVYREGGLASLAEVSIQFREYYRQLLGHDRIQVEPESEEITFFDPSIVYIFVTHLEPVLPEGCTLKHFLTHTNISEFTYERSVYEEPIVNAERQNSLVNQALKKTIVKVDGSFPSCRRRLRVLSANSSLFSPLEFACQKLELKANQINAVLNDSNEIRPLDVKGLQLLLQGAVMPTVNAGPLSYAEAFTQPEQKKRYGDDGMHVLELSFRKLMSACDKALQVNETVIAADQQTYHEVLLASFEAMHERLSGFFGNSFRDVQPQEGIADGQKSAMR
ncbi:hypothetical protein Angca_009317, partial [Angiostrongylus cantonensis]